MNCAGLHILEQVRIQHLPSSQVPSWREVKSSRSLSSKHSLNLLGHFLLKLVSGKGLLGSDDQGRHPSGRGCAASYGFDGISKGFERLNSFLRRGGEGAENCRTWTREKVPAFVCLCLRLKVYVTNSQNMQRNLDRSDCQCHSLQDTSN